MKKLIRITVALSIATMLLSANVFANPVQTNYTRQNLVINGKTATIEKSINVDGSNYYNAKDLLTNFGVEVSSIKIDLKKGTVGFTFKQNSSELKVVTTASSKDILINGKTVTMDKSPILQNGTVYLPVRALSDAIGCSINFNKFFNKITVTTQKDGELTASEQAILKKINDAYIYAFPLVMMDTTQKIMTNCKAPNPNGAPINQIVSRTTYPDAKFKNVVKANVDTLYSSVQLDLTNEPLVFSLPDFGDRYYVFSGLDQWTNSFLSVGTRTGETKAQNFAIVGPDWKGTLPKGMKSYTSPTSKAWVIIRTQIKNKADVTACVELMKKYKVTPLSAWGTNYVPPAGVPNPKIKMAPPAMIVSNMDAQDFFNDANVLLSANKPYDYDKEIVSEIADVNVGAGKTFDMSNYSPLLQEKISEQLLATKIEFTKFKSQKMVKINQWSYGANAGVFGNDYLFRASIALIAIGNLTPQDAVYALAAQDSDNNDLTGANNYVIHFNKDQLPKVGAFWSITPYDSKNFLIENPINRYALGDKSDMKYNADGSLDLYLQNADPGADKTSNWIPTGDSTYTLLLRLYEPDKKYIDGTGDIPSIVKAK